MAAEGTFVLADIGGYTSFLTGVGIEHAKEITQHLLNTLIKTSRRAWKVGNVMGDCVFFYAPTIESADQTFSHLRRLYHAFQDAQLEIASGSTCRCGACDRTEDLSLKFVVHAGEYAVQNIAGRKELIGADIVLATRLLKNSVPVHEYVIATEPARDLIEASGLDAASARDDLEGIGPVQYQYVDLGPIRAEYKRARGFYLTEAEARVVEKIDIEAPAEAVWSAMREMKKRAVWAVTVTEMSTSRASPTRSAKSTVVSTAPQIWST